MSSITDLLAAILAAKKGEEVRGSIHDAIELCYQDGKAGVNDLEARQLIETVAAVNEQQQAALEVLQARVEELESGEGGSSQQSTTIDIPTVLVDGGVVENVQVNNNSTKTQHVTFTTAFTEVPRVMVAIGKNVGAVSQYGYLSANILYPTVTATGFDFFLANRTGSDRSPGVVWYAYQPTVKTIDLDITIPETEGMTEAEVREITGPIAAAVDALKTGYDGTSYQTAAEAVRTQINDLHVLIGDEPGTAISADSIGYEDGSVADALAGLNGRLDDVTISKAGANINTVGYEGGYINSAGADTSAASYETIAFRSNGYIPVSGGKTLYWWGKLSDGVALGANAVIVEYDESKNLIGARHQFNKYGTTASDQAFTTSPNAAYVRIALYQGVEDKSTIQIALYYDGDEQAAYIPPQDISVLNYDKIYNGAGQSVGQIIDEKISDIGATPLYDYEEITVTGESGALRPNGTVTETTDVTRYKIPVSKGERYVVSARHGYAYKAFLILDSEDNIISYYPETNAGTEIHRNVQVDIEQDGFLVLQNVYNFMPVLGKVSGYTSNDKLYQKSVYWNGDSICFGAGGKSFADQISLVHAMPETMDAVSGTRLSTRSGATNSIYERVTAMDTSAEYDYIGIEGGYNDYFSSVPIGALMANYTDSPNTTTVIGAVEGICKHIRTNFPNSKFFFVLGHRPIAVGAYPTEVDTYWDAIISALEKWAVPYVDIRKEGTLMAYNSDWLTTYFGEGETMGTHPNALGYKLFYNDLVDSKMQSI